MSSEFFNAPNATTRTRADVERLLKKLLGEICGIQEAAITSRASIDDDIRLESAQLAQVQVELEEQLTIEVDFLEILRRREFASIVDYVYSLLSPSVRLDT
jgi:acyl carrier protein